MSEEKITKMLDGKPTFFQLRELEKRTYCKEEITEHALPVLWPIKECGIYFLIDDDEIVYVGQSKNLSERLGQHIKDDNKIYNLFFFMLCNPEELNQLEAKYILKFRPKYNKTIPRVHDETSMDQTLP